eukprot:scaffold770_cov109-Cylindrotheca_fusiformis.AAC.12
MELMNGAELQSGYSSRACVSRTYGGLYIFSGAEIRERSRPAPTLKRGCSIWIVRSIAELDNDSESGGLRPTAFIKLSGPPNSLGLAFG